ncbi:hypothetical protein H0H92_004003 [Tricholoma furcatifolium]|nr:hypothetical protein H0H92_004003 [Tricholoma furcatifolium]
MAPKKTSRASTTKASSSAQSRTKPASTAKPRSLQGKKSKKTSVQRLEEDQAAEAAGVPEDLPPTELILEESNISIAPPKRSGSAGVSIPPPSRRILTRQRRAVEINSDVNNDAELVKDDENDSEKSEDGEDSEESENENSSGEDGIEEDSESNVSGGLEEIEDSGETSSNDIEMGNQEGAVLDDDKDDLEMTDLENIDAQTDLDSNDAQADLDSNDVEMNDCDTEPNLDKKALVSEVPDITPRKAVAKENDPTPRADATKRLRSPSVISPVRVVKSTRYNLNHSTASSRTSSVSLESTSAEDAALLKSMPPIDLQGASRTTGGVIRGKASGNNLNIGDMEGLHIGNFNTTPVQGEVIKCFFETS